MKSLPFNFSILAALVSVAVSSEVPCEKISELKWDQFGDHKSCFMDQTTTINSHGVSISSDKDETVLGLRFHSNKKISFLPVQIHEKFSKLVYLTAGNCDIVSIAKDNFKNLRDLERLYLHENRIEIIDNNVFEDLTSLLWVYMPRNRIKLMNGNVFDNLKKLESVYLVQNKCIDMDFVGSQSLATLPQLVSQKCGFYEKSLFDDLFAAKERENAELRNNLELKRREVSSLLDEMQMKTLQINEQRQEIQRLKTNIETIRNQF